MFLRLLTIFGILSTALILRTGNSAFAAGPAHGAKGAGMGTAFAAVADDPSAITHNPGGIGFLDGTQLYLGGIFIKPETTFKDTAGNREETEAQIFGAPHLYLTSAIGETDLTLGLGIFSPFGIGGREWSDQSVMRYISTDNLIATLDVNPTVAWRPLSSLSLAFGAVYMWAYDGMEQKINQSMVQAPDGQISFEGDGDGWGWNLGLLWKPVQQLSIGAAYRSSIEVEIDGDIELEDIAPALQPLFGGATMKTDGHTSHDFPQIATLSMAWDPIHNWTVVVEGEWTGWSSFDNETIRVDTSVPAAGFGDINVIMDWDDSWIIKIGTEYRLDKTWALRCGYSYLTSPVPDETLTPANPDSPQHNYFLGVGYSLTQLTVDLFYSYAHYEDRDVTNQILSGEYSNQSHTIGMSLGWKF